MTTKQFLKNLKENQNLEILGKTYKTLVMNFYTHVTDISGYYAKILLTENHVLVVCPDSNNIDFGYEIEPLGTNAKFPKTYMINNKKYIKTEEDYQIVKKLVFGNPLLMEGECLYANYICEENGLSFSPGYIPRTNTRADILMQTININEIILK